MSELPSRAPTPGEVNKIVYGPTLKREPSEIEQAIAEQQFNETLKEFNQAYQRRDIEARDVAEMRLGAILEAYPELRTQIESQD